MCLETPCFSPLTFTLIFLLNLFNLNNGLTNYVEIMHDAVWYLGEFLNKYKFSRGYFKNSGLKTTFLERLELSK